MIRAMQISAIVTALVFAGLNANAAAQTQAAASQAAAPQIAQAKPRIPLRVQVVISRYQGDKRISSVPYTLSVNANTLLDGGKPSSVRMGARIPVQNPAFGRPDGKPPEGPIPFNYQDVGTNIDCYANSADDGRFELNISIEESSVYLEDQPSPTIPRAGGLPVFRSFRSSNELILRDGQSAQFTAATDRITGELLRVDVTLTVLK
jgi:hypothetical protein